MEDFRTSGGERARQIERDLRSIEKEAPDPCTRTLADLGIWPPPPPPKHGACSPGHYPV